MRGHVARFDVIMISAQRGGARPNDLFLMGPLKRLYERYDFSASAVITDPSGIELPARVSNISYGGCRLLTKRKFTIGAEVIVKIQALEEEFEAPAKVVHSGDTDMGVMFGKLTSDALFVLQKWIAEARYIQSLDGISEGKNARNDLS